MKKWIKIIAVLLLLGIIAGVLGYFLVYNKPHVNYEKAQAEFQLTGEQLFTQFSNSREPAERQYNGKVIAVTGRVSAVETPESLTVVVFVLGEGMFGDEGIRFTMLEKYGSEARRMMKDDLITIKGYCTGYNGTDVIFEQCSIIK